MWGLGCVRCRSVRRPSVLMFLIIIACGCLLMMIVKGMLNSMETRQPTDGGKRQDLIRQDLIRQDVSHRPDAVDVESQILQEIRNQTIRTMCSQKNISQSIWSLSPQQIKILLQHIMVNDKYHFLYCYITKVASSNWKRVLKVLNGSLENVDVSMKMNPGEDLQVLSSLEPEEINYRLQHYFKFMFVREPMDRLLSAYNNKFGNIASYQKSYGVEIIKKYRKGLAKDAPVTGEDVTFEEFIRFLLDEDVEHMNQNWMPMYNLCQPCAVSYDFIGSLDHLESDAEFVLQHIGAPPHVHFPQREKRYKPVTTETLHYYVCSLPQELLRDLLPKYIIDFSLFAYPLPNTTTEHCLH